MMIRGLGLNPIAVPFNSTTGCPAGYQTESNNWCFDSTNDWMLYGNLPQYQSAANPANVAAQTIALANAKANGIPVSTTTIVQGGGAGIYSAPAEALAPGVTLNASGVTVTSAPATSTVTSTIAPTSVPASYYAPAVASSSSDDTVWIIAAVAAAALLFFWGK